jgi:hypothetical protein
MRTTVTIDDTLYRQAIELAEPGTDKNDLFRGAVKAFVRLQALKRQAVLGRVCATVWRGVQRVVRLNRYSCPYDPAHPSSPPPL